LTTPTPLSTGGAAGNPKAIVNMKAYHHEIIDTLLAQIPVVYDFDHNLLGIIQTGDCVGIEANNGIITVSNKPYCLKINNTCSS